MVLEVILLFLFTHDSLFPCMLINFEGEYIFGWSLHTENLFDWIEDTYILMVFVLAFGKARGHFSKPWPSLVQLQNFRCSIFKTSQTYISNCLQGNSTLCMFSMLTLLVSVHRLFMVVWLTLRWFPLLFVKNGNHVFSRIQLFYTKRFYKRTPPYY